MNKKSLFCMLITAILFGCEEAKKEQDNTNHQEQTSHETPQTLEDNNNNKMRVISSKRYNSDIILDLYNEAVEQNAKLKKLNDEIEQIHTTKNDNLVAYSKFSKTNKNYWLNANKYISLLQDSALRESTREAFKIMDESYQTKMTKYTSKVEVLRKKEKMLNDQLILMKLFVTASMMKNYQSNEQPNIKTLENMIEEYDRLIEETKEYTKVNK